MKNLFINQNPVKAIVLFNSDHGRYVTLNEFTPQEIWKKSSDDLNWGELKFHSLKNEILLEILLEIDNEYDFVSKIKERKFIKKLLRSNIDALEEIESSMLGWGSDVSTLVILVDVKDGSYDVFGAVDGNHVEEVLKTLNSWVDSELSEDGSNLLTGLEDYLNDQCLMIKMVRKFEIDEEDSTGLFFK
jgi:hypothetical protein